LTIIPILRHEMVTAARHGRLQAERRGFVGALFVLVVGSFGAWYYWADGELTSATMARIADEVLRWSLAFHGGLFATVMLRGALSIARERERRTLDFLLVTRMSSAEIVLGKLAACVIMTLAMMAAGLPVMLLLHVLGGADLRLILLAYAGFASSIVFLSAVALWISAELPDRRAAGSLFLLSAMAWLIGPFSLTVFLPRWGIRLPDWLAAANWWLVSSSPISVIFTVATGLPSWSQLVDQVGRMAGIQLGGAVVFTAAAIVRLRPAHRAIAGIDRQSRRRARRRLVWRFRPRPPVGDDPILWREKYTSRESGLLKAANILIFGGLLVGLSVATFFYARPAFVELWRHGYGSAATAVGDPDMNIILRVFLPRSGPGGPVDTARVDFNLFIRYATIAIIVIMSFVVGGMASEVVGTERLKDTWTSLLGTPLGGRDIVRSVILAAAWRSRGAFGAVLVLWTLGLVAGAIHPLGYLVSVLELAASVGLMAVFGVLGSLQAEKAEAAVGQGLVLTLILMGTGVLPMLLPVGLNSVLWGAASLPLVTWTSLLSYRELSTALASPLHPQFQWVGLPGGQMPMLVFSSWLIGILGPAVATFWMWKYTISQFDRLVGRPHRTSAAADPGVATPPPASPVSRPAAPLPRRGSPLAEADAAV
jgi:ABC-type transport system involved in multi-copper enzyme maturation permease subunit